jgi:hypothetical protein
VRRVDYLHDAVDHDQEDEGAEGALNRHFELAEAAVGVERVGHEGGLVGPHVVGARLLQGVVQALHGEGHAAAAPRSHRQQPRAVLAEPATVNSSSYY